MHSFLELAKGVKYFNFEYCQILWQQIAVLHHRYGLHGKRRTIVLFIHMINMWLSLDITYWLLLIFVRTSAAAACGKKKRKRSIVTHLPAEDMEDILPRLSQDNVQLLQQLCSRQRQIMLFVKHKSSHTVKSSFPKWPEVWNVVLKEPSEQVSVW